MDAPAEPVHLHASGVDDAIRERFATRAFLPKPVPRATLEDIFDVARHAPSGSNTQPWRVYVLRGKTKDELTRKVCAAHDSLYAKVVAAELYKEQYPYYPEKWISPYIERRRQNGWGLYNLQGIAKGDHGAMHAQHQRNFRFFDAPVGLMFTMDRRLATGSFMDYGMFIQSVMMAAQGRGLASCPQTAWNEFWRIVLPHIGAQENEILIGGMSLGWADQNAIVNSLRTPREQVSAFTRWLE